MTDERHAFLRPIVEGMRVSHLERVQDAAAIEQIWRLEAADDTPRTLELRFRGETRPPALAEITEVSPHPPVESSTSVEVGGLALRLEAPGLPASAQVGVELDGGSTAGWEPDGDGARLAIAWSRRLGVTVRASLAADHAPREHSRRATTRLERRGALWCEAVPLHVPTRHREGLERIASGAVAYVNGCTQLRTAPNEACLLTDHRLLPLSWTRDAYYQALLLLAAGEPSHLGLVADHLRWLWGRCVRPDGVWQRSHLANGEPKDLAFQADQQLFPVLELLDFREATGIWPAPPGEATRNAGPTWGRLVDPVRRALPVSPSGLVRTDENPADDPSSLPHSLSVQILAWYVVHRLAGVAEELGLDAGELSGAAELTRDATARVFGADGPHGPQWAYEVDGGGTSRLYADANDVPTALAAAWGFCRPDDPLWRATMRFAFDEANPAYRPGPWGGLGSLHTPGTWPLGDAQEWIVASAVGERDRSERALDRLVGVASGDGLLPEAYDPETGAWTARHWFAWPASLVGSLVLAAFAR